MSWATRTASAFNPSIRQNDIGIHFDLCIALACAGWQTGSATWGLEVHIFLLQTLVPSNIGYSLTGPKYQNMENLWLLRIVTMVLCGYLVLKGFDAV